MRLRWLATQTPGVAGIGDYIMTATALYQNSLPTATPPASPTPEATAGSAATEDVASRRKDPAATISAQILNQAQSAAASSQWQDAIDLLDVIIGADPTFETQTVRTLMVQSLNSYARELYNANKPAEANLIVDRAETFGRCPKGCSTSATPPNCS